MIRVPLHSFAAAVAVALFAGCAGTMSAGPVAEARLEPTRGNATAGSATFQVQGDAMTLHVKVEGLKPGAEHGFHIHELGDCSAPDGTSAGGHFNPEDMPHGGPLVTARHVGDMGNLGADSTGSAYYQRTDRLLALNGPHSIIGRAVIVHAEADEQRARCRDLALR